MTKAVSGDALTALVAEMLKTAEAHEQWAMSPEAFSTEAATCTVFAANIRDWVDRLRAALIAAGRSAATTEQDMNDDEPLHTGDDERLDCVTSILAGAEELEGDDEVQEIAAGIIDDCHKLDALILATIKRERQSAPAPLPSTDSGEAC